MDSLSDYPKQKKCRCGNTFNPRWLESAQKYSKVCNTCACEGLAKLLEEECPGDTLKDISDGEQAGAYIRGLIGR